MSEPTYRRKHYVKGGTGGTTYPPVFEVVIHGETVGLHDSYATALAAFRKSCAARGIRVPKVVLVNE